MDVERQNWAKLQLWGVNCNLFARNGRRTSKIEKKNATLIIVNCNLFARNGRRTSKLRKIATLRCQLQPFRTKWASNIKNWGKVASSGRDFFLLNFQLNKMKPTNPNAHTYVTVTDTDVQTHFAKQRFLFQYKVLKINCRVWSLKDKVWSVECKVWSVKPEV